MNIRPATTAEVDDVLAFWADPAQGQSVNDDRDGVLGLLERDPEELPSRRRQGVARMLVAMAEARFAASGGRRSDAMVLDDNSDAGHAWRSLGYTREDHWSRWVRPLSGPSY